MGGWDENRKHSKYPLKSGIDELIVVQPYDEILSNKKE